MSNLDMSLDDMIKMNKKSEGTNRRGRARNSGPRPSRRFPNRNANRMIPYSFEKVPAPDTTWEHDMFADHAAYPARADRGSAIETGTKLYITNLDYKVSSRDIKELFSEVGDIKRCSVQSAHSSGTAKATAEVVFSRRKDAEAAVKKYNNVQLDGKTMKIEIVGTNTAIAAATSATNGTYGNQNGAPRSSQGRVGVTGLLQGSSRPIRSRGRGRVEKISAEDLDTDLEKYYAEANTNKLRS